MKGKLLVFGLMIIYMLVFQGCDLFVNSNSVEDITNGNSKQLTVLDVIGGTGITMALTPDHEVYTWGYGNYGLLAHDSKILTSPTRVNIDEKIAKIFGGHDKMAALSHTGEAYLWGKNRNGGLGYITERPYSYIPQKLDFDKKVTHVSLGLFHTLLLTDSGEVYEFGYTQWDNVQSDYVDEDVYQVTPSIVPLSAKVVQIATGTGHSMVLTEKGQLYIWGGNLFGELGHTQSSTSQPTLILFDEKIKQISAGDCTSFVLTETGKLYAWGANWYGQLGIGNYEDTHSPTKVMISEPVASVSMFVDHGLALLESGEVYSWGWNGFGQLGNEDTEYSGIPKLVDIGGEVIHIINAFTRSFAVVDDGTVYGWGGNAHAQLLDGSLERRNSPVKTNLTYRISK